jgi:hypothetical protein
MTTHGADNVNPFDTNAGRYSLTKIKKFQGRDGQGFNATVCLDGNPTPTLADCSAAGVPVFRFGSPELDALHEAAFEPAVRVATRGEGWRMVGGAWHAARTYAVYGREYGWSRDGFQYVVDHGGFYTLNTLRRGQRVPQMVDLPA